MSTMPTQPITPELRAWIVEQARVGVGPQAVLESMRSSGWAEAVALAALETTLAGPLAAGRPAQSALLQQQQQALSLPGPRLDERPLYFDAHDRRVHVLAASSKPRLVVFGELLSAAECDALIDAARPRLARSLTVAVKTGDAERNDDRTSDGMFFTRAESPLIEAIEARIAALLHWPVENGEGLQLLRYPPGAEYKPHYDYFDPAEPGTPRILQRGGQRVATLIIYLNEPERGGGTVFPDLQLEVAPKRGNAVFFSYGCAHPSTRTLHGGAPVLAGEKWIATKWLRERRFD